ncbi:MAG: ribosome maturation factor RimM [Candidatus Symbiothrix sp.]|jgi:16S rRNA processing protein RimM|nr:ribosome maturation factor RimM [Candidatus Symbiothrix sp.]
MIAREELISIGRFGKPHGVRGELSFTFTDDVFDESEHPFLICEMDGIFVPFRIVSCRFVSDTTAFVKLNRIDSAAQASAFANKEVYFAKKYLNSSRPNNSDFATWDYFLDYTLIDRQAGNIGRIVAIEDSTQNVLFIIETSDNELLIPATPAFISHINHDLKQIFTELPEGMLDIV